MSSRLLTTDRLESPLVTLGSSNNAYRTYCPYGHFRMTPDAAALGFTGQRIESNLGGYLLGSYRVYSPILMRFLSADSWSPFGEGGANAYAYCAGDPVNRRDPSGHVISTFAQVGRITGLVNNAFSIGWVGLGTPPKDNLGVNVNRAILGGAAIGLAGAAATLAGAPGAPVVAAVGTATSLTGNVIRVGRSIFGEDAQPVQRVTENLKLLVRGVPRAVPDAELGGGDSTGSMIHPPVEGTAGSPSAIVTYENEGVRRRRNAERRSSSSSSGSGYVAGGSSASTSRATTPLSDDVFGFRSKTN